MTNDQIATRIASVCKCKAQAVIHDKIMVALVDKDRSNLIVAACGDIINREMIASVQAVGRDEENPPRTVILGMQGIALVSLFKSNEEAIADRNRILKELGL